MASESSGESEVLLDAGCGCSSGSRWTAGFTGLRHANCITSGEPCYRISLQSWRRRPNFNCAVVCTFKTIIWTLRLSGLCCTSPHAELIR